MAEEDIRFEAQRRFLCIVAGLKTERATRSSESWELTPENSQQVSRNLGFHGDSDSKESAYNAGDQGSIPGLGRSLGERNSNLLQYYCLENSMDRGAWQSTVRGVAGLDTTEWLT